MSRPETAEEVTYSNVWLCNSAASYCTGTNLDVAGVRLSHVFLKTDLWTEAAKAPFVRITDPLCRRVRTVVVSSCCAAWTSALPEYPP